MLERVIAMPRKLTNTTRLMLGRKTAVLQWATEGVIASNWGDKLNPYLASRISRNPVLHRSLVYPLSSIPIHFWIGSHLATACSSPNSIVWGAGFISSDVPIVGQPTAIHAVRGWLSDERLRKAGIETPGIVGDPALLLPRVYEPRRALPRKSLGVIPHCHEWDEPFFKMTRQWEDTTTINICGGIEEVVEQIVSCDLIVSSSLHGIICADAYGVPAIWLRASDKPKGDGFKFLDYFSSVGRTDQAPIAATCETTKAFLRSRFADYSINIDLDALWRSCPLLPA